GMVTVVMFFFSSRRRHTRFSRDWSSDVCSSDLQRPARGPAGREDAQADRRRRAAGRRLSGLYLWRNRAGASPNVLENMREKALEIGRAACRERGKTCAAVGTVQD